MARKLFDCFLFFNELDMLEIRLRETGEVVDHFVLVESTRTFQGKPKPLSYHENRDRYEQWVDKIVHVVVDDDDLPFDAGSAEWWRRETYQRNQVARGLKGAGHDDLVMVSDVDEIARAELLAKIKTEFVTGTGYLLSQRMYYGNFNRRDLATAWDGPRVLERRRFRSGQLTRRLKSRPSKIWRRLGLGGLGVRWRNWHQTGNFLRMIEVADAGWHFSSIGTYENWRAKVDAFSHPECKDWASYKSPEGYTAWLASLVIEPLEALPKTVREPRFAHLLAPTGAGAWLISLTPPSGAGER